MILIRTFIIGLIIAGTFFVSSCRKDQSFPKQEINEPGKITFSVDHHNILKNGTPFKIKGVVYVPGYPGYLPWEIEKSSSLPLNLRNSINTDLANIKAMGANTVRFWGAPKYCYEALKNTGGLYFLQTIWINGEEPDFQNNIFKENTKAYIREVVDRIYSVFRDSPPIIAYIVGNELSEASIMATDAAHPEINKYVGHYIKTDSSITATEAFLAEMADYTKTYEYQTCGHISLVTYANDIRTTYIIDTPFLDFISQNAYSYAIPYYRPNTSPGTTTGTLFQGWIEEVKSTQPNKPLLITETGLSVSPNAYHAGPPDYGYGGNTETEQATGLLQNVNDINKASLPIAGVCIHEYLDSWWKFGLDDSYSQDPDDIEEWFGLVKIKNSEGWYTTEFRSSYNALKTIWYAK